MFTKMNNECIKSPKVNTSVPSTSTSSNCSSGNIRFTSSTTNTNAIASNSSPSTLPLSSSYLANPAQFDVTAIAAVVNASNHLPVTTPSSAAAVVAVAVSSLAAAIIPDTPIVSIAGSTLSEITTTTTSTKTTPTPVPTSQEADCSNYNPLNSNRDILTKNNLENRTSSSTTIEQQKIITYSGASVKDLNPMSVANSSTTGELTNASTTAAIASAAERDNITLKQTKNNKTNTITTKTSASLCSESMVNIDLDLLPTPRDSKILATTSSPTSSTQPVVLNTTFNKTENINAAPKENRSKDFLSESWEESRLKDWDDSKLKELLDEAYSYKNPRDKENKSKTFLQLLEKAENEDQSYPFRVTSRGSRNLSTSITSNNYHYYQNTHYHSQGHNHNRSHHHHKQGGSLQDLFEIGLNESQLDCDQTFGIGITANQRTRRQNHNSRQKKYSSSVSSRQREGGSLPSNVNAAVSDTGFMQQEGSGFNTGGGTQSVPLGAAKSNKKEQRRNASKAAALSTSTSSNTETKENNSINGVREIVAISDNRTNTTNTTSAYTNSGGDFIIDMGEPMIDIQQQQKILHAKGKDAATQGHPFYERLSNSDKNIGRPNIVGSTKGTYFAPTTSHCYVDETIRFSALERNGGTNNGVTSTIDAKFLPLDENYKSCKSVLGGDGDKTPDLLGKPKSNSIYTKISSPTSSSAVLSGAINNISAASQRQLDENGNALGEIQQNASGVGSGSLVWKQINSVSPPAGNTSAALLNSCGNVSTSATVTISPHTTSTTVSTSATVTATFTAGPSQAKAKAKKKSQQERNTKTVDVESVAGYRGKDPVEELVKYIESSSEDKQGVGSGTKSTDKKKDRKKDKEKHQKLKKSNSLEELRSGAKMEVHELKRTAATTESNTVLVRQKSGGGSKQNKNNSSSTADINKNLECKSQTQNANTKKSDRRSWGNEDLKYLEDQHNANFTHEDKIISTSINNGTVAKDRKNKSTVSGVLASSKEEKETKDKIIDRIDRNLNISSEIQNTEKFDKSDKMERSDKTEKIDNKIDKSDKRKKQDIPPNAVTVVDIQAIESVLPETAEFHVVTKKKKPKKQKIINNLEETTVTFNRTHNFTMQKTSTFNQQQQQMTVRYKYYHHDNTNNINTSISNMNANSQHHHQLTSAQHQQHQQQQSINYSSNVSTTNVHHQSQQNTLNSFPNTDKNRRKSTSSVPPSEKSDSSDLDSVHSLPIESTKANNSATKSICTLKESSKQRAKVAKSNNTSLALSKNQNSFAPISYADIARTTKEINDAAFAVSASGILINNNEISTECRNIDTTTTKNLAVTESLSDDKPISIVTCVPTTIGVTTSVYAFVSKPQKPKKSQIKQDFPELVCSSAVNDDKIVSLNTNHKTITYSQSLTAIKHNIQSAAHGSSGINSASDTSPPSSSDFNTKASPTELQKNVIVYQHANITPVQHSQQQILQKSKSVENDSMASTNYSSSATYMASLNSNNLDQQYPALEKTVKRHSSSNVTPNTNASNYCGVPTISSNTSYTNQTPFNFAAAAKQQIASNYNEQPNSNSNKNSALATSIINNMPQTSLQTNVNFSVNAININGNIGNFGTTVNSQNNTANKKSTKEKSPPLLSLPNNSTLIPHNINQDCNEINSNINPNIITTSSTAVTNSKKSKKERQQQLQQQLQLQQHGLIDNSTQSKLSDSNVNMSGRKISKTLLKSSNSFPLSLTTSSSTSSTNAVNRPAVIILNDDRNSTNFAADNQFTFGDFNEEELKLFDDDNSVAGSALDSIDAKINIDKQDQTKQITSDVRMKSPSMTYLNDSEASYGNDMGNNSNSDILLSSSIEASSPNMSLVSVIHTISGGAINIPGPCKNQSSDSGIYTDKSKSSNNICSGNNNGSKRSKQQDHITPTKEDNKLNSFLSNTRCTSVHTSMDNLEPSLPPPQQLETCNDIETAIIAAARAAAKHQQPAQYQQLQHQYKNSNASSSSSSFSSSSLTSSSMSSTYQHQYHNNNMKRNYPIQHGSSSYSQLSQQPQYEEDCKNENESVTNTPQSRSPSRPRRISIAGGTVASKEFDIHFIPPTTMPTAFSTQQHNDIIIDFIGSAWEEVANSKVTKFYDGQ